VRQETEREEEIYVRKLLGDRYGACLHKIPKSEQEGVKTPDYELLVTDVRVAVLEVKRLVRTPRTPENGWQVKVSANGIREASRTDNAPQRVSKLIHEAWKQLHIVPDPKILVFVNDESQMDSLDLQEAFNGFLHYGNDSLGYYKNAVSAKVANGAIREEKWQIDLYVWIDRCRRLNPEFRVSSETGLKLPRRFFGCPDIGESPNHWVEKGAVKRASHPKR
jgi:hypothetical protein